ERAGVPAQVRPPYAAPGRVAGPTWDRRADVFSLAALVYEMLWARRISGAGHHDTDLLTAIAGGDLSTLRAVFGRALAEDPVERFGSSLEFASALSEAFSGNTIAGSVRLS